MERVDETTFPDAVVELQGAIGPDLAHYVRQKMAAVLGHTGQAVLRARVRVMRYRDPACSEPVVARADVDLDGTPIHVVCRSCSTPMPTTATCPNCTGCSGPRRSHRPGC